MQRSLQCIGLRSAITAICTGLNYLSNWQDGFQSLWKLGDIAKLVGQKVADNNIHHVRFAACSLMLDVVFAKQSSSVVYVGSLDKRTKWVMSRVVHHMNVNMNMNLQVVTFDKYGVSGHPNHMAVSHGVRCVCV